VNGAIDAKRRATLRSLAQHVRDTLGFGLVYDWPAALEFQLPKTVTSSRSASLRGSTYLSPKGAFEIRTEWKSYAESSFVDLYVSFTDPAPDRSVEFADYSPERFIVSGTLRDKNYYRVFVPGTQGSSGFTFLWSGSGADPALVVARYMASTLKPLRRGEPPDEVVPIQPPIPIPAVPNVAVLTPVRMGTFVIFRGDDKLIALEGEMTSSSPLDFLRALRDRPKANIVLLNSQGGPLEGLPLTFRPKAPACRRAASSFSAAQSGSLMASLASARSTTTIR
jgi:hypothetical protein